MPQKGNKNGIIHKSGYNKQKGEIYEKTTRKHHVSYLNDDQLASNCLWRWSN